MGLEKQTIEQEAQTRYETAFETLACRCLGEPYNFYRIAPMLLPGTLNSTLQAANSRATRATWTPTGFMARMRTLRRGSEGKCLSQNRSYLTRASSPREEIV